MGDSICFRVDVLLQPGWGEGLTEDYHLRYELLLNGIRIAYEPAAIGYGEAPLTWVHAQAQRARWLRGTHDTSQQYVKHLIVEGMKRHNSAMLDGALQASFPSYSTLSLLVLILLAIHILIDYFLESISLWPLIGAWVVMIVTLLIYPMIGSALERAPVRAHIAVLWQRWLALISLFGKNNSPDSRRTGKLD